MPPRQRLALCPQPIGAGRRQPMKRCREVRREFETIADLAAPMGVIGAAARVDVEQPAGDVGEIDAASVFIFEFDETTAAAAVTEAFPLRRGQVFERLLPIGVRLRHPLAPTLWFFIHLKAF